MPACLRKRRPAMTSRGHSQKIESFKQYYEYKYVHYWLVVLARVDLYVRIHTGTYLHTKPSNRMNRLMIFGTHNGKYHTLIVFTGLVVIQAP